MLKWPDKARRSLAIFFVKWNDFDVFVEDTARYSNTLYTAFISRIVEGHCKVEKIIPLGDRAKVISAAAADKVLGGRRRIYLIDGDLDLVAGLELPVAERMFVHRVYHIENYFLCEEALVHVLHEENPRLSEGDVKAQLDFAGWITEIQPLFKLFQVFGLTRDIDPSLPTIKLGIGSFSTNSKIDPIKIDSFCATRLADLATRSTTMEMTRAQQRITDAIANFSNSTDWVSFREYLYPILRSWISSRGLQLPSAKESLMVRLAKVSSIERHKDLVIAVTKCATA
jgi:Protein of unknown function (DUF4435)